MSKSLTFLSIAFRNVVRNRQKTVTSVLGIILAVTLIFGETISIELQSGAVLQHEIEEEDSHFSVFGSTDAQNTTEGIDFILNGLMNVSGIGEYTIIVKGNIDYYQYFPVVYMNDYNSSNTSYSIFQGVYGSKHVRYHPTAPPVGSVVLTPYHRDELGLTLGQTINLTFSRISFIYNETGQHITVDQTFFTRPFIIHSFWQEAKYNWEDPWYYYDSDSRDRPTIYLNGEEYLDIFETQFIGMNESALVSMEFTYESTLQKNIYRDTSLIKARKNADAVNTDLSEVIDDARLRYNFNWVDLNPNYTNAFESTEMYFSDVKWILIALSVPIIIFGLYLGYLGIDLFLSERRREIGMLKARGATNRQLMVLLITESLFVGAFAGGAGIILAGYGSRFIVKFTGLSTSADVPWYDPNFSMNALLSAICLGMILMFGSSVHLFRRITKLEAGELLSRYSAKQEKPYNAARDLKILGFAAVCLVAIYFFEHLENLTESTNNILLELVVGTFTYLVIPIMVLSAPYIIIVIGIRLATRGSPKYFIRLAEIAERLTGELGYLIRRGIATGNRRIVNLTTVLSVLFAFLVLVSTFTHAQQGLEERTVKTEIGSDIRIVFDDRIYTGEVDGIEENLTSFAGVRSILPIFTTYGELQFEENAYVSIFVTDCSRYADISYFDDDIFEDGSVDDVRSLSSGGMIISPEVAKENHADPGDDVDLVDRQWNQTLRDYTITTIGTLRVKGVLKTLPGLYGQDHGGVEAEESDRWILVDDQIFIDLLKNLDPVIQESKERMNSRHILVDTDDDVDPQELEAYMTEFQLPNVDSIRSMSQEIEEIRSEPTSESFVLILRTELGVLIFISLFASATVVFISSFEKIRERAAIMLRGTTSRQLHALEFGEALVILVYALIVGILTGLLAGIVWIYVFNQFEGLTTINRSYWPSFEMLPIIGFMVVIFLGAVAVSTWKLKKFDLIKFVRWG